MEKEQTAAMSIKEGELESAKKDGKISHKICSEINHVNHNRRYIVLSSQLA